MLLIGSRGRGRERERYLKRIMNDLASERARKVIGLSGITAYVVWVSFGEYIMDLRFCSGAELRKRKNSDSSSSGINAACTSSVFIETSREETISLLTWHSKSR